MLLAPQQATSKLIVIEQALAKNIQDAEMDTGIAGRGIALAQTVGPFKQAYLNKYRPGLYSRRKPRPPADPALINTQTGLLNRSWQLSQGQRGQHLVTAIFNESEHAAFIAGSGTGASRMMHRPVEQRIAERLEPIRIRNLSEAIRRALST